VTTGSTYDNRDNLAESFYTQIISKYEGTRLGRQELNAEVLDDNPNSLWSQPTIDDNRIKHADAPSLDHYTRIAIAVDPAATSHAKSDDTGIVVTAIDHDGEGYVLYDGTIKDKPSEWGQRAIDLYAQYSCDIMVAEVNNGGEMVEHVIRTIDNTINFKKVVATRGKAIRAEPIAALYEQGRIHHVGNFPELENELVNWSPNDRSAKSPNRMDALVWAMTELFKIRTAFVAPNIRVL
jgi:phage terminase large subunit-like protein